MKFKVIIIFLLFICNSAFSTDLNNILEIQFPENKIVEYQKLGDFLTYNEQESIFEEFYSFDYKEKRIGFIISYNFKNRLNLEHEDFATQLEVSQIRKWSNAKKSIIEYLEKQPDNSIRSIDIGIEELIRSKFMEWTSGNSADVLTYDFAIQDNTISHIYIQFFDIWNTFNPWQSKLDFSMLESLLIDNPTSFLFQIIDSSVRNLTIKLPFFGKFNNSNVRVRKSPNLESEQLGKISEGTVVKILEKSHEKMKISNMLDYWYKIKTKEGLIGWSYGYFIDMEE